MKSLNNFREDSTCFAIAHDYLSGILVATKIANHQKPPETIHNYPKPSTRNHLQCLRTIHYHPKLPKTNHNPTAIIYKWSETIHIHLRIP